MRYQEYQKKMWRTVKVLATVRRFRVLIIAVLCAVAALIAAFLATKGIVFGEVDMPSHITYGDTIGYSAKGLFAKVQYEYLHEGKGDWVSTPPTTVGNHQVRAVTKGAFGQARYGEICSFVISPRPITVYTAQNTIMYGSTPTATASGLAYADTVFCDQFDISDITKQTTEIIPLKDFVTLKNAEGQDVTSAYIVTVETRNITFTKRDVIFTVQDQTFIYDGKEHKYEQAELAEGTFANGDYHITRFDATLTEVGSVKNPPSELKILTADGEDVTLHYNIKTVVGNLIVDKRPFVVESRGDTWVYDGTAHKNENYTVDSTQYPLLDGHKEVLISSTEVTDVTSEKGTDNYLNFDISDGTTSVKDQYYTIQITTGKLVVTPRPITIKAGSDEKVYDGIPLENLTHTVTSTAENTGLSAGHNIEENGITSSLTNFGEIANKVNERFVVIVDAAGKNVTANYAITPVNGTLKVTARPITIVLSNAEKQYDGTKELPDDHYTIEDLADLTDGLVADYLTGIQHYLTLDIYAEQSTVCEDGLELGVTAKKESVLIKDQSGGEVQGNYSITIKPATLTITKRPISIISATHTWVYDGEEHSDQTVIVTNRANQHLPGLVLDHTFDVVFDKTASVTTVADTGRPNTYTYSGITDGKGNDVSGNYTFNNLDVGFLYVEKRELVITASSAEWVYDGATHTSPDKTVTGLLPIHELNATVTGEICDAGSATNLLTVTDITGKNGSVMANYDVKPQNGILRVTPRPVVLQAGSQTWVYDGYSHALYEAADVSALHLVGQTEIGVLTALEHRVEIVATGSVMNYTEVPVENKITTYAFYDKIGNNISANYEVKPEHLISGELKIEKRVITITIENAVKVYDGTINLNNAQICSYNEQDEGEHKISGLAYNQSIQVSAVGSQRNATIGQSAQTIIGSLKIYDRFGDPAENNYIVDERPGTLTIDRRPITIEIVNKNAVKVYDGTPLTAHAVDYTVSTAWNEQGLLQGSFVGMPIHDLYFEVNASLTDVLLDQSGNVTTLKNPITAVSITENGEDVLFNYLPTVLDGTLKVTKRPLTVTVGHVLKTYDGLTSTTGSVTYTGLAPNQNGYSNAVAVQSDVCDSLVNGVVYDALGITDEFGNIIKTTNYEVTDRFGTLTVTKRPLNIWLQIQDANKIYDGTPLTSTTVLYNTSNNSIDIDAGLLEGGVFPLHTITFDVSASLTDVVYAGEFVTTVPNPIVVTSITENGVDKAGNYEPHITHGTLRVDPRPIHIWLSELNAVKVYDGTPLTAKEYDFDKSTADNGIGLLQGSFVGMPTHELFVDVLASLTDVVFDEFGKVTTVPNRISQVVIKDAEDKRDRTSNYLIKLTDEGTLQVDPRPISIWLLNPTAVKVYDGTALTSRNYDFDKSTATNGIGLLQGSFAGMPVHTLRLDILAELTDVAFDDFGKVISIPNLMTNIVIEDEASKEKNKNYIITADESGTLQVDPRPISIWLLNPTAVKVYDGTALTSRNYDFDKSTATNGIGLLQGSFAGMPTHDLTLDIVASLTNVIYENGTPTSIPNLITNVVIRDRATTKEKTQNYLLDVDDSGTLQVNPRPIWFKSEGGTKVYDGLALLKNDLNTDFSYLSYGEDEGLLDNPAWSVLHELVVNITGIQIGAGSSQNLFEVAIVDALSREDVTANYEFSDPEDIVYGTLQVNPRPIWFKSEGGTKVYDGLALVKDNLATDFLYLAFGEDEGLLENTPWGVNHQLAVTFMGKQTNKGSSKNSFTVQILDANDGYADVTANYEFEDEGDVFFGDLVVTARPLTITSHSAGKVYDGIVLDPGSTYTKFDELAGVGLLEAPWSVVHILTVTTVEVTDVTPVGGIINAVTYTITDVNGNSTDEEGNPIADNYEITVEEGTLTITARKLTVTVSDVLDKVYDGTTNTNGTFTWTYFGDENGTSENEGLASGQDIDAIVTAIQSSVCTELKDGVIFESFFIYTRDEDGIPNIIDLNNYDITYQYGTLTISKRDLYVKVEDVEKVYDGTPLTSDKKLVYGIVDGQGVIATITGSITDWSADGVENIISGIEVYALGEDGTPVPVTDNYNITSDNGMLRILKRPVTITVDAAYQIMAGVEIPSANYTYTLEGEDIGLLVGTRLTVIGAEGDAYTYALADAFANDVPINAENYVFTMVRGTIAQKTEVTLPEGILCELYTTASGVVYLRTDSFGAYGGGIWGDPFVYDGVLQVNGIPYSMDYLTGLALQAAGYSAVEMTIYRAQCALLPYYLAADGRFPQTNDTMYSGTPVNSTEPYVIAYYAFNSNGIRELIAAVPAEYADVEAAYREFVYANYSYVPVHTRSILETIIRENGFANFMTDADLIAAVVEYIKAVGDFTLDYDKALDSDGDVVEAFLSGKYGTDGRPEGSSQHFAMAATLLFRALGLPARYVEGYRVDLRAETRTTLDKDDMANVTYAWVEVYMKGIGWIQVDVTGVEAEDPEDTTRTPIKVFLYKHEKEYDGTPLSYTNRDYFIAGGLKSPDHKVILNLIGEQTEVGTLDLVELAKTLSASKSTFKVVDGDSNDVTHEYRLEFIGTGLTITKRNIILAVDDHVIEKVDADENLDEFDWKWTLLGELVSGEVIDKEGLQFAITIGDDGKRKVEIVKSSVAIRKESGEDTSTLNENYEITLLPGNLTVVEAEK